MTRKSLFTSTVIDEAAYTAKTCPSKHRNRGDDICADCDTVLNLGAGAQSDTATAKTTFRNYLSATMQTALAFEYYEVRPCIECDRRICSYADEEDYAADLAAAQTAGEEFRTFWSLYGIDASAHGAIGDFVSKDAAHEVMNAILAVPAAARNAIQAETAVKSRDGVNGTPGARAAGDWLDDLINQSSNHQRI